MADPSTLTGSIGVISTVPNLQDLYSKIGYKDQVFKSGPHKDMLSPSRPITPDETEIMQGIINDTYEQFVQAVVQGRGLCAGPGAETGRRTGLHRSPGQAARTGG